MRILVVDDEKRYASLLKKVLVSEGFEDVETALTAEEAAQMLRDAPRDLVVTDIRMPGMSGMDLLGDIRRTAPGTDVILMTAFADISTARDALKRGALDYLVKPFDNDELLSLVRQVDNRRKLRPSAERDEDIAFAGMVTRSPVMYEVFDTIERAARSEATVMILGESGTGKELVARALHSLGARSDGPFVDVNCAGIPDTLIESELFGHEKGAFTGANASRKGKIESAAKGTLFLDEIGEMPLDLQPKMLRFLQERSFYRVGGDTLIPVDARIVVATNQDIAKAVQEKSFREDLYFRLAVVVISIPPLRERKEDIRPLVHHCLGLRGYDRDSVSEEVMAALEAYDWPGNVRELNNAVEHTLFLADGERIVGAKHLPKTLGDERASSKGRVFDGLAPRSLNIESNEKHLIEKALAQTDGNKSRAADLLGISRRRLYSRMSVLGISDAPGGDNGNG